MPYVPSTFPKVGPAPITPTPDLKYLGVLLDAKLSWHANTREKVTKAKVAIGSIRRLLKNRIPLKMLRTLLLSKVLPVYLYGIVTTYPRNKGDRICLERLNRYVAKVATNDFTSPYVRLLGRASMQTVFQTVLQRRIQLAQRYSKGQKYIPPNCIQAHFGNPNLRQRFHRFALATSEPTGMRYKDSALELTTQVWNRVPPDIVLHNEKNIKMRILEASYRDAVWELDGDMESAILTL